MGSGKSTVGRILARELEWELVDLDRAIAESVGRSIPEIFEDIGEPHFRELERLELQKALEGDGAERRIVSCGGGIVTESRNREALIEVLTVFLWEDAEILYRRTRGPNRPLRGTSYEDFSRRYAERLPYYLEVASLQIEPEGRSPRQIAEEILIWIREQPE